ncbi:MAG TPA: hypothetical protein VHL08_06170 [Dongiaceae bacterium]|jgi:hypothetical protein|nr:hypothetical protein [Dongiaceae bacterium]
MRQREPGLYSELLPWVQEIGPKARLLTFGALIKAFEGKLEEERELGKKDRLH